MSLLFLILIFFTTTTESSAECFSCMSNSDWSYYMQRIPGLLSLNSSAQPPYAPFACTFDPMRVFADKASVYCKGFCYKWTSAKITSKGNIEVSILRGCYDRLIDPDYHASPADNKCYQTPDDYSHRADVEYKSECFCKGFMCNSSKTRTVLGSLMLFLIVTRI